MSIFDLIRICQAEAIANKLAPTESSLYRRLCRKYSETFNTDLLLVESMDPAKVILTVYEHQMDKIDEDENFEDLVETINELEDPDYDRNKEKEVKDFIEDVEEEERLRIAEGRKVGIKTRSLKKPVEEVQEQPANPPTMPTGGFLNLSKLTEDPNER